MIFACLQYLRSSVVLIIFISLPVSADFTIGTFTVFATINPGCFIGSRTTDTTSFGTLNFGNVSSLATPIDVRTAQNAGSIVIRCFYIDGVTLAIDAGKNMAGSNIATDRRMKNSATGEFLTYQIYQDSARTVIWGDGTNGGTANNIISHNERVEVFHLNARLFATPEQPSAGIYTDTLSVTVTY